MGNDKLIIKGARAHNLKNISVELPRDKLIVFTGLSGSGKSSLAFDTIYAEGQVIMYADSVTPSMEAALRETDRRRQIQHAYNEAHGIVPQTIRKDVRDVMEISAGAGKNAKTDKGMRLTRAEREELIRQLTKEMKNASRLLEFEHAAILRDRIKELQSMK